MHSKQRISSFIAATFILVGCATQKVEYRTRPTWHSSLGGDLPNQSVQADGTIVKFSSAKKPTSDAFDKYLATIKLVETDEVTGKTILHAVLPTHIFTQALTCLRDRNWELLYEQVTSESSKAYYDSLDDELTTFTTFFEENRQDIAKTLQRMLRGSNSGDVQIVKEKDKSIYFFSKRVRVDYVFNKVTLIQEGQFLKLHSIE